MKMIKVVFPVKAIILLALAFSNPFESEGKIKKFGESIPNQVNTSIDVNDEFTIVDTDIFDLSGNPTGHTYNNVAAISRVYVELEKGTSLYSKGSFSRTIVLDVTGYNTSGAELWPVPERCSLTVNYNPVAGSSYTDKHVHTFAGTYKLKIKIVAILGGTDDIISLLRIGGEIESERYTNFQNSSGAGQVSEPDFKSTLFSFDDATLSQDATTKEIIFNWETDPNADEYDIEWTYVDNYLGIYNTAQNDRTPLEQSDMYIHFVGFDQNASRVTLDGETISYRVSPIFDQGYVIFRIRSVGYKKDGANIIRVEGPWSDAGYTVDIDGRDDVTLYNMYLYKLYLTTNRWGESRWVFNLTETHELYKNWQYSATYAEGGKKKEIISYFDGSQRERQIVTGVQINGVNKTIVAETIYDNEGRPAIQILPSPTPGNNSILKYHENFNRPENGTVTYSREDFDKSTTCTTYLAKQLSTSSGAGLYYSELNNEQGTAQQRFVPDADGYAFAQTTYTSDNTGRIASQGSVGQDLGVGSGHEPKFYYTSPTQQELDRLFGSEAGYAEYYKKRIIIDPNGQASVEYTDNFNRVIATGLVGDIPQMYDNIGDQSTHEIIDDLDKLNTIMIDDNALTVEHTFFATGNTVTCTLNYSFIVPNYEDACMDKRNICFDCIYDLEISIKNECGDPFFIDGQEKIVKQGTIQGTGYNDFNQQHDETCSGTQFEFTLNNSQLDPDFELTLPKGQYTITKRLTVNESALDYYTNKYIEEGQVKVMVGEIEDVCIKTYEDFLEDEEAIIRDCIDDACGTGQTGFDCAALDERELLKQSILKDVSPGGQYARYIYYDENTNSASFNYDDPVSVLNEASSLPMNGNWRTPLNGGYKDADGNQAYVDLPDGRFKPENLPSVEDFIKYWQPSWADALAGYHPEYCIQQWLYADADGILLNSSKLFDNKLFLMTWEEAVAKGASGYAQYDAAGISILNDPYQSVLSTYSFSTKISQFKSDGSTTLSMSELAWVLVNCPPEKGASIPTGCIPDPLDFSSTCFKEELWEYYKGFYISEKQKIYRTVINSELSTVGTGGPDLCLALHNRIGISGDALYADKQKRFYIDTRDMAMSSSGSDILDYIKTKTDSDLEQQLDDPTIEAEAEARADMDKFCATQCSSYIPQWRAEMKPCKLSIAQEDELIAMMLAVCKGGCDQEHPLGTRSADIVPESENSFKKIFELAAQRFDLKEYQNSLCTDLLITVPPAENRFVFGGNGPFPYMDVCACEKIFTIQNLFTGSTAQVKEEEFEKKYGEEITDFEGKLCHCTEAYLMDQSPTVTNWDPAVPWKAAGLERLKTKFIPINSKLTCQRCITCGDFYMAMGNYIELYAKYTGLEIFGPVFTEYMNNYFGQNQSYPDYSAFAQECVAQMHDGINCGGVTTIGMDLMVFLDDLAQDDVLIPANQQTNALDLSARGTFIGKDVYLNGTANCDPYYQVLNEVDLTKPQNNRIQIKIKDECGFDVDMVLYTEDGTDIDWGSITGFYNLQPRNTTLLGMEFGFYVTAWLPGGEVTLAGLSNEYYIADCGELNTSFCLGPNDATSVSSYTEAIQIPADENKSYLDTCGCNKLFDIKKKYIADHLAGRLKTSAPTLTFNQFFEQETGFKLTNLDAENLEKNICYKLFELPNMQLNSQLPLNASDLPYPSIFNHPEEDLDDDYYPPYIYQPGGIDWSDYTDYGPARYLGTSGYFAWVPEFLHCKICKTCNQLDVEINKYLHENHYQVGAKALEQLVSEEVLTTVFQSKYDVIATGADNCTNSCEGSIAVCTKLSTQGNELFMFLNYLASPPVSALLSAHDPIPATAPFYNNSLNPNGFGAPNMQYIPNVALNTTEFDFYVNIINQAIPGTPYCTIRFHSPDGALLPGATISALSNPRIKPTKRGNNYTLLVDAVINGQTKVLEITTCWPIGECCPIKFLCNKSILEDARMDVELTCELISQKIAVFNAQRSYDEYIKQKRAEFRTAYIDHCLHSLTETFHIKREIIEKQYTLYYYDMAGSLVKTVPPAGVTPLDLTDEPGGTGTPTYQELIDAYRDDPVANSPVRPSHSLVTNYRYNSENQVIQQHTPDGGLTTFWYDEVTRVAASQNEKQKNATPDEYSYTVYDALNRPTEAGQIENSAVPTTLTGCQDNPADCQPITTHYIKHTNYTAWLDAATQREQVTYTVYDKPADFLNTYAGVTITQTNLRKRVASSFYFPLIDMSWAGISDPQQKEAARIVEYKKYESATHYTYDIHGNVNTLWQENRLMPLDDYKVKRMDYEYDLVSGNVHKVYYQKGKNDQFIHQYFYDGDNRIIQVHTSLDGVIWDQDAAYTYYQHGPLARIELGDQRVQGMDYAYTLQGWLKGANSEMLDAGYDMGRDGDMGLAGNPNDLVARDAFGFMLGYFNNDYKAITATSASPAPNFEAGKSGSGGVGAARGLYNGNIRYMITSIGKFMQNGDKPLGTVYTYDQLNRITGMSAYNDLQFNSGTWSWGTGSALEQYANSYAYDRNGNIQTLKRNGDITDPGNQYRVLMDDLIYSYYPGTNKLAYISESANAAPTNYEGDLEDQSSATNYTYDEIGNLIGDAAEGITSIEWTITGKVKEVVKSTGPSIEFFYGPDGKRIGKRVKEGHEFEWDYTFYTRDDEGNTVATYDYAITDLSQMTYQGVINSMRNVLGNSTYRDFLDAHFSNLSWYYNGITTQVLGLGTPTAFLDQKTPGWYATNVTGMKSHIVAGFTDDELVESTLNYDKNILTGNYIFMLGGPNVDPKKLIEQLLMLNCNDFLTRISIRSPALINWLYTNYPPAMTIPDLCTNPFSSLANSIWNYCNNPIDITILPDVVNQYSPSYLKGAMQTAYILNGGLAAFRTHLSNQANIVDILHSYYPTQTVTRCYAYTPLSNLMNARRTDMGNAPYCRTLISLYGNVETPVLEANYPLDDFINLIEADYPNDFAEIMNNYTVAGGRYEEKLVLNELSIYGSDRLGLVAAEKSLYVKRFDAYRDLNHTLTNITVQTTTIAPASDLGPTFSRVLGYRRYELKNHLGNVQVVITDRKVPKEKAGTCDGGDIICEADYFEADVFAANDYYPFGQMMPGRTFAATEYRYGFNGKEYDKNWNSGGAVYDYGFRIYDPRIAKFFSVDPLTASYPGWSPYPFAMNRPVDGIDLDGLEYTPYLEKWEYDDNPATWGGTFLYNTFIVNSYNLSSGVCNTAASTAVAFSEGGGPGVTAAWDDWYKDNIASIKLTVPTWEEAGSAMTDINNWEDAIFGTVTGGGLKPRMKPPYSTRVRTLPKPPVRTPVAANPGPMFAPVSARINSAMWNSNSVGELCEQATHLTFGGDRRRRLIAPNMTLNGKEVTRVVDVLVGTVGYESKGGFTRWSGRIPDEFTKDLALLETRVLTEVVWVFYRSPRTGMVGADEKLLQMFKEAQQDGYNIRSIIIDDIPEAAYEGTVTRYPNLINQ